MARVRRGPSSPPWPAALLSQLAMRRRMSSLADQGDDMDDGNTLRWRRGSGVAEPWTAGSLFFFLLADPMEDSAVTKSHHRHGLMGSWGQDGIKSPNMKSNGKS
uniref:Uncharacterized protein n=1 Tax=Oryza glumipatula TaxID=40148 RepID=A0A0D9ZJT4_9ORYZ